MEAGGLEYRADMADRLVEVAVGRPPKVAVPAVIDTSPSNIRSVVVLPAPLGPRNPVTRPAATSKLRSSTATTSELFGQSVTSMAEGISRR